MSLSIEEWLLLAVAVLAVALGIGLGVEVHRYDQLKLTTAACVTDRANFADTQKGNLSTIADLQRRLSVLAEARKVEQGAAARELARVDAAAKAATERNAALSAQLEHLYATDPGARAWGDAGVDAGVAASLPKR